MLNFRKYVSFADLVRQPALPLNLAFDGSDLSEADKARLKLVWLYRPHSSIHFYLVNVRFEKFEFNLCKLSFFHFSKWLFLQSFRFLNNSGGKEASSVPKSEDSANNTYKKGVSVETENNNHLSIFNDQLMIKALMINDQRSYDNYSPGEWLVGEGRLPTTPFMDKR